jgi:hypothetical protein
MEEDRRIGNGHVYAAQTRERMALLFIDITDQRT